MSRISVLSLAIALAGYPAWAATPDSARAIHEGLLTLDSHLDTPANLSRPGWDIMDRHRPEDDSQVDYPRMVEGGLDGGFFAIYTAQGPRTPEGDAKARDDGLVRALEIREMVARHGDRLELALRADDAAAIAARGRRFVFMSIENSYPLEADLGLMSTFQKLGVRLIGPAHFKNNDLADSSTDTPEWGGLSPKGKLFVAEANRLGLMLDASHSSDAVLRDMIALSKSPVVLSHSGCKAVFDHPRNIDDTLLKALAASGGVIQINAYGAYLIPIPKNPERDAAMAELSRREAIVGENDPQLRADYQAARARYPQPRASMDDFVNHLLHALEVVGPDHVGIGTDMDGGGGVVGMEDVADYPKITERLLAAGYGKADLEKIWGGNLLRVMRQAEAYAAASH